MKQTLWITLLLFLAGCSSRENSLMPLKVGQTWTYEIKPGFQSDAIEVKVSRALSVGPCQGYELTSGYGSTRLGWDGDTLLASQLGGTVYDPPVPLLSPLGPEETKTWRGNVVLAGKTREGIARLSRKDVKTKVGTFDRDAVESILNLEVDGQKHEILTWFVKNLGIVRQEQRRDGILVNRVSYLSGP